MSYQTVLGGLACKFQPLNVSYVKKPVKNIAKALSLYINAQVRGGINVVFRKITPSVGIIQPFQILVGRFHNIPNKALRKSWMLGYFK